VNTTHSSFYFFLPVTLACDARSCKIKVRYINRVELLGGLIKIELYADRMALSERKVRVKFNETAFYLFGNEVKRGEVKGSGVWEYIFSGFVTVDGERFLLRVMKTPSTFIIAQRQGYGG
jgi:hypothetical protein